MGLMGEHCKWFNESFNLSIFQSFNVSILELLSEDEVELAAAIAAIAEDGVETIGPVNTEQAHHGQEDADTDAGGTLHVEGVEVLDVVPGITTFHKSKTVDVRGVAQDEGIAQLQREAVIGIARVAGSRCRNRADRRSRWHSCSCSRSCRRRRRRRSRRATSCPC